nr:hypothetical protein GCM10025730_00270 [Promicromonospora thailandica]
MRHGRRRAPARRRGLAQLVDAGAGALEHVARHVPERRAGLGERGRGTRQRGTGRVPGAGRHGQAELGAPGVHEGERVVGEPRDAGQLAGRPAVGEGQHAADVCQEDTSGVQAREPAREPRAERGGHGRLGERAAQRRGVPVGAGQPRGGRTRPPEVGGRGRRRVAQHQHERRVEHVLAGQPGVHRRGVLRHGLAQRGEQRDHGVAARRGCHGDALGQGVGTLRSARQSAGCLGDRVRGDTRHQPGRRLRTHPRDLRP